MDEKRLYCNVLLTQSFYFWQQTRARPLTTRNVDVFVKLTYSYKVVNILLVI